MPEGTIPVFVFPNSLKFHISDRSTHKQILTLYNPYDFAVKFQVLCSSKDRHKYTVVDPEGKIQTHCCVDIVVRHNAISSQNIGQTDKFRIEMFQFATNKVNKFWKKDVIAELVAEEIEASHNEVESFQQLPQSMSGQKPAHYSLPKRPATPPSGILISIAVICISTLLFPTAGEVSTVIPEYLKPTVHLKLVVSYVLGLLTMVLLRPT